MEQAQYQYLELRLTESPPCPSCNEDTIVDPSNADAVCPMCEHVVEPSQGFDVDFYL